MKKKVVLGLLLLFGSFCEAKAQSSSTQITRIEIDGKEYKKSYKVFFLLDGKWAESERTPKGFIIPDKLKTEKYLTMLVTFGKYRLEFSEIHTSKFSEDWIVGIDKKPFSEEFVTREEAKTARRVYYIEFEGNDIGTRMVVIEKKK